MADSHFLLPTICKQGSSQISGKDVPASSVSTGNSAESPGRQVSFNGCVVFTLFCYVVTSVMFILGICGHVGTIAECLLDENINHTFQNTYKEVIQFLDGHVCFWVQLT